MQNKRHRLFLDKKAGFTLLEVVIGLAIVTVMFVTSFNALSTLKTINNKSTTKSLAHTEVQKISEAIYNELLLNGAELKTYIVEEHGFQENSKTYEKVVQEGIVISIEFKDEVGVESLKTPATKVKVYATKDDEFGLRRILYELYLWKEYPFY